MQTFLQILPSHCQISGKAAIFSKQNVSEKLKAISIYNHSNIIVILALVLLTVWQSKYDYFHFTYTEGELQPGSDLTMRS